MRETGKGLILCTVGPELGLGLVGGTEEAQWQCWDLGREMAQHLHPCLAEFLPALQLPELAFIAVCQGPGSFTGTRLGVVTARTLAQQLQRPLFGISTLAAGAWSLGQTLTGSMVLAIDFPAQRDHVYGAIFQVHPRASQLTTLQDDSLMTTQAWHDLLSTFPESLQRVPLPETLAITQGIAALAQAKYRAGDRPRWQSVIPFYGETWKTNASHSSKV